MKITAIAASGDTVLRPPYQGGVAYRNDEALSRAEFEAHVRGIALELRARPERDWMICCEDAFYFVCGFYAALYAGKRLIVPPNFQPGTIAALRTQAEGAIVDRGDNECEGPALRLAVSTTSATPAGEWAIAPEALVELYTSGTTGAPKRISKQPSQLLIEVEALEERWGKELQNAAVVSTVPHHHIYGLLFRLLWPLYGGRPFDVVPASNPNELLERLRKFGRAIIVSSPAQLGRWPELIDLRSLAPYTAAVFCSGGPLSATTAAAYANALGAAPTEVYGSSETGGIAWRVQSDAPDSQAWTPSPRVETRIDAAGTLRVRSPFVGGDAWFEMADSAQPLADGRFCLIGRTDRIVKLEEKRLSLPEVERRLAEHPWVSEAGAVVLEDRRRQLAVVAVLTDAGRARLREDGKQRLAGELRRFLSQYYEAALLPRRWRFVSAMPHNERGKISAAALAELFTRGT